jgi:WD40 repeat protein/predicted Ser/Thr protein kinase
LVMTHKHVCGKCGAELTGVGAEQLCPGCLLEGGLDLCLEGSQVSSAPSAASSAPGNSTFDIRDSAFATPFPRPFGDYELLEEIARGGMGVVYKARQVSLDRIVAVKMLLFGPLAQPEVVQRFRTEAAAAASLQHPNIVAIHEVGFREGQHFFAMDYVAGRSLADIVRDGLLPARRAADYIKTIAEAIEYAHQRGILHRDLKPSNVLIDGNDQPKVTDFGLAKRLEKDTELTLSGQVLGSPSYMPPEQAAAHRGLVGKRSDVYSLGAILYHLLTGRAPFVAPTMAETLQQAWEEGDLARAQRLLTAYRPGLNWSDLRGFEWRYLWKLCQDESRQTFAQFTNRVEGIAFSADGSTLAAASGNTVTLWHFVEGRELDPLEGHSDPVLCLAFSPKRPNLLASAGRDRTIILWDLTTKGMVGRCSGHSKQIQSVAFSPDGKTLGSASQDGTVKLWEVETQRLLYTLEGHKDPVQCMAFSPDNRTVASGGGDLKVRLWDVMTGKEVGQLERHTAWIGGLAFSADGRELASASFDSSIVLWDLASGKERVSFRGDNSASLACSSNGLFLAVGKQDGSVTLFDTRKRVGTSLKGHSAGVRCLAFAPDSRTLASTSWDGTVKLWNVATRQVALTLRHVGPVEGVAFSRDGNFMATCGADPTLRLWPAAPIEETDAAEKVKAGRD